MTNMGSEDSDRAEQVCESHHEVDAALWQLNPNLTRPSREYAMTLIVYTVAMWLTPHRIIATTKRFLDHMADVKDRKATVSPAADCVDAVIMSLAGSYFSLPLGLACGAFGLAVSQVACQYKGTIGPLSATPTDICRGLWRGYQEDWTQMSVFTNAPRTLYFKAKDWYEGFKMFKTSVNSEESLDMVDGDASPVDKGPAVTAATPSLGDTQATNI